MNTITPERRAELRMRAEVLDPLYRQVALIVKDVTWAELLALLDAAAEADRLLIVIQDLQASMRESSHRYMEQLKSYRAERDRLLTACKALVNEADQTGGSVRHVSRYEVDRARTAIAKTEQ